MAQSIKPFATIDEQIDVLVEQGLELDRAVAAQGLNCIQSESALPRVETTVLGPTTDFDKKSR